MPLSAIDRKEFIKGGWTLKEIERIEQDLEERPQKIDPFNEAWQRVFADRHEYVKKMLLSGLTIRQIHAKIDAYIAGLGIRSPWDYIREVYPVRGGKKTDFNKRVEARVSAQERAKNRIQRHFGKAYKTVSIF